MEQYFRISQSLFCLSFTSCHQYSPISAPEVVERVRKLDAAEPLSAWLADSGLAQELPASCSAVRALAEDWARTEIKVRWAAGSAAQRLVEDLLLRVTGIALPLSCTLAKQWRTG